MRFINSILTIIIFLIVSQIFSHSALYSAEIPYIQYKKPDGTIAKYPLTELKSITFGYLTCYDKCLVVLNDSTKKTHDPQSLDKIYFDSVKKSIIFSAFAFGYDGQKHNFNIEYPIDQISYIKFYEFLDNIYNGKRLTRISVLLKGLKRTIIEENYNGNQSYEKKEYDTSDTQEDVLWGVENPEGCFGATITGSSINLKYNHYYEVYYPQNRNERTDFKAEIILDTSKKVIQSFYLYRDNILHEVSGSHLLTYSFNDELIIQDIPYKINENGFIEVLNTEIPISNIIKYTYFKSSSEAYGGGANSDTFTMSKFSAPSGKVFISLEFGWKNK